MKKIQTRYSIRDGGHYSSAIRHNGTLYISGQLSIDPEVGIAPEGIRAQAAQALKNLETVLIAAGAEKTDVLMCRVYLPDVALWEDLNVEYARFFGEHKPARVVVPTNKLYAGCLVEIEAIAQLLD